jgi:hypothetical protein
MSADRYKRSAKTNSSGSWNKYSYSGNDPVNRLDKHGREECYTDDEEECDGQEDPNDGGCGDDSTCDDLGDGDGTHWNGQGVLTKGTQSDSMSATLTLRQVVRSMMT